MLTQEAFVVADRSASMSLQRSSWKAEAIRRGDLKISGPLPITEETPLNDDEEREFAEKGVLENSLQQTQEALDEQARRSQTPPQPVQPPPSVPRLVSALSSNPVPGQSPQPENVHTSTPTQSPPMMQRVVEDVQRQSLARPLSFITPSPFRSTPDGTPTAAHRKMRKSGLRGAIRKMLGRKGRDEAELGADDAVHRGHSYHHSDPGMLQSRSSPREQDTPSRPRISDLPAKELQPSQPIGPHLPFPMNVNAPQASPPHDYLTFDTQRAGPGYRRATLPTMPSTNTHRHSLDEPRGRMYTWEERLEEDGPSSPGIGIALSSPAQVTPVPHKRRSRSADALPNLVKDHAPLERGRSAEIKRWRESYMSGDLYIRPETAKTVRTVPMSEAIVQERDPAGAMEMSATFAQTNDSEAYNGEESEPEPSKEVQASVSAFNFGNLGNEQVAEEGVAVLQSETSNSPAVQDADHAVNEDRIQHLENVYENLEGSLRRMSTRKNRQTIILENAPRNLRTRDRSASNRSMSASRSHSRSQPSIHQEPMHQKSSDTLNPGLPSPILAHSISAAHMGDRTSRDALQTVYEALKHERSTRKALEHQVRNLRHDVSDLHALVNKLIVSATATGPGYPTPSLDALVLMSSTEDRLLTPRADQPLNYGQCDIRESVVSKFSHSENDSESCCDEQSVQGLDTMATPDVWATPKEEIFSGSGFFPGDARVRAYA